MFAHFIRAAIPALVVAALAAAVTLLVSPEARAAVQTLLNFNGVTVTVGDDGKLVASGDTDAIVQQDDYSVAVQSDDGCQMMGVAIAPPTTSEFVLTSELAARYPDLALPHVPAGYTPAAQSEIVSDGQLVVTWANAAGQTITYGRNPNGPHTISLGVEGDYPCNPAPTGPEFAAGEIPPIAALVGEAGPVSGNTLAAGEALTNTISSASGGGGQIAHVWETDSYLHLLTATDPALSVEDLKAMQP